MSEDNELHILSSASSGVLTLRFNRPEKKNAIRAEMFEALGAGLREAADDPGVRCVLFAGSATVFTSGNDLVDSAKYLHSQDEHPVIRFLYQMVEFPKPMVAAVNLALRFGLCGRKHEVPDAFCQPGPVSRGRFQLIAAHAVG